MSWGETLHPCCCLIIHNVRLIQMILFTRLSALISAGESFTCRKVQINPQSFFFSFFPFASCTNAATCESFLRVSCLRISSRHSMSWLKTHRRCGSNGWLTDCSLLQVITGLTGVENTNIQFTLAGQNIYSALWCISCAFAEGQVSIESKINKYDHEHNHSH